MLIIRSEVMFFGNHIFPNIFSVISESISEDIPPKIKILNTVSPQIRELQAV